jgi:hypothetical protein
MLIGRRRTLMLLAWASSLPLLLRSSDSLPAEEAAASRAGQLRALIREPVLARMLGRAYRAQYPEEAEAATLTRLLWRDLGLSDVPGPQANAPSREQLWAALETRVRAQFGGGDSVQIQGWMLARTEARLCALCE